MNTPSRRSFWSKAALLLLCPGFCLAGNAQDFFTYDPAAVGGAFVQAPVLDNSNASAVADILAGNEAAGFPLAVRVREVLTNVAARAVVTDFRLGELFGDYFGTDRATLAAATAKLALSSPLSRKAFSGNFNLYPNAELDTTRPAVVSPDAARFQVPPAAGEFRASR